MINRKLGQAALAALLVSFPAAWAAAEDPPATGDTAKADPETARITAETARINADAARINAQAARDRARVDALGLPHFDGSTQLGQGVGAIEATMLTSHAVDVAAGAIAQAITAAPSRQAAQGTSSNADHGSKRAGSAPAAQSNAATTPQAVIVVAGDEALDFGRINAFSVEMDGIHQDFTGLARRHPPACAPPRHGNGPRAAASHGGESGGLAPTAIIAAVNAAAGLLRSNTQVDALDLPKVNSRMLATAVAARLAPSSSGMIPVLPTSLVQAVDENPTGRSWEEMNLLQKLTFLQTLRGTVQNVREQVCVADRSNPTNAEKALLAPYDTALARFDGFVTRAATPDANGVVPLVQAARLALIAARTPLVLRVSLDQAGGSLVRTTNLLTTLAIEDPVRVSGGLVATYSLTDPASGDVRGAGIITCRTTLARLESVQGGIWTALDPSGRRRRNADELAHCSSMQ